MNSLWSNDIIQVDVVPPSTILRMQGTYLGQITKNIVLGKVSYVKAENDTNFHYSFGINAPIIGGYEYTLLSIVHGIEIYPLTIINLDRDVIKELDWKEKTCTNEQEFEDDLRAIFKTDKCRKLISVLVAQSSIST